LLAVGFSLQYHLSRFTARRRNHLLSVALGFLDQPLPILERAHYVVEGVAHFTRRVYGQQSGLSDQQSGSVLIEQRLEKYLNLFLRLHPPLGHGKVNRVLSDGGTQRDLGRSLEHGICVLHMEGVRYRILHQVLDK